MSYNIDGRGNLKPSDLLNDFEARIISGLWVVGVKTWPIILIYFPLIKRKAELVVPG